MKILTLAIIISFYFLILLQTSFLVHFDIFSGKIISYGLVLIPIVLISILMSGGTRYRQAWRYLVPPSYNNRKANLTGFASQNKPYDLMAAFSAGFFLDIFSGSFVGFHILILVLVLIGLKFILQKYVQIPIFKS